MKTIKTFNLIKTKTEININKQYTDYTKYITKYNI